jgi:Polysaccharide lyase
MKSLSILLIFCGLICGSFTTVSAAILWSADHETGDFSQWESPNTAGDTGIWISGQADAKIVTTHKRSGQYGNALTIYNADGDNPDDAPGVRMARVGTLADPHNLPQGGYYSVWYYFPQIVRSAVWWNVFQWKRAWVSGNTGSSDPVLTGNIGNRAKGNMYLYLYNHVGSDGKYNTSGVGEIAFAPIDLPVGTWVHVECYYLWSTRKTGRITCWQDGVQIWDLQNIITEFNYGAIPNPRQWTINNYSDYTDPATQTIYIDDAVISTERVWAD